MATGFHPTFHLVNNERSRVTSFLPTSNPSPISGRLGLQRVRRERARTWVKPTPGSLQINLLFTILQNRHRAFHQVQTYFSSKDIFTAISTPNCIGGAERDRTADPLLAKQVLSQLSYSPNHHKHLTRKRQDQVNHQANREWWARVDSNYRPHAYQACALTN